ncbi:hydantoinase [Gemmiger sp. An120]|uniref:hydantoinase/oxoprolinase family protein n=1 Tax=Gemmiger TaxID=204475 RepID=UPI000B38565E|nr:MULTISPECIES: hydantoinase/oxoprolinase family protein [Gemmiger]MBM6915378.1 hydantoinase/oxoprolinase family protein [Gemmiger formicilis]OUQ41466.1 hydantoinase [Gemmiger sp. An120]
MKVRIGIDVGGTFTDAVAIDNDTYEVIGVVKTPTTHDAKEGVAAGIIQVLHKVMEQCHIAPEDVVFIAHGTTQATNALLEGDVAKVGVITLGQGLQGAKSKGDTTIGDIELAPGKFLRSENSYVDTSAADLDGAIRQALEELKNRGCTSFVAAEAFSVDDPAKENRTVELCREASLPGTATNDISKLYGLKIRTRTAVVNASIMPKMLEAATMTDESIKAANIESPLMVMRCDGGVMTVDEVRNRPILTILSGPAAGVAGALMYEKLTDGIFFEVGGTSTDISCVKDGKVMIRYAEVGGHKTYLNSLDVRTVGIGGGSMVEIKNGKAVNTGPRSAHIAGLDYEVYTPAEKIVEPKLVSVRPMEGDPEYACIECAGGVRVALTMAGAANLAGFVRPEDYAYGNVEAARKAWQPLADNMGCTVEEAARKVLDYAAAKNSKVAAQLLKDYDMDPRHTVFVGGGGGAATVVPHLAQTMGHKSYIAKNAPVISTIGVALAMVRDMVERSVTNPTEDDIISVRREAELKAIQNGAAPGTVEVSVEVDTQRNIVRAIAVGATEMRSKDRMNQKLDQEKLLEIVAENLDAPKSELKVAAQNGVMYAVQYTKVEKKLFGLVKKSSNQLRLIDEEGVIRLQKNNAWVRQTTVAQWEKDLAWILEELTEYNDGGTNLPNVYVVLGKRIIDLSGLQSPEQIASLGNVELAGCRQEEPLILAATKRVDA